MGPWSGGRHNVKKKKKISLHLNYALSFHQPCADVLRSYYQVVHRPSEFSRKLLPSPRGEFCQNITLCFLANHEFSKTVGLSIVLLAPYNNHAMKERWLWFWKAITRRKIIIQVEVLLTHSTVDVRNYK